MHVRVQFQRLAPGVQDHQAADLRPQVPRGSANLQQRLPHGAKQDVVKQGGMCGGQRRQFVRHGEHHVEILDGEQFPAAGFQPGGAVAGLTLRTVAVATRIIEGRLRVAGCAALKMATHRRRATGGQRRQNLALLHVQAGSAGGEELGSVAAEDFADFVRRPGFRGGVEAGP